MTDLNTVDKSAKTKGQTQYHIRVKPGEVRQIRFASR